MPQITAYDPATAVADADQLFVSQGGVMKRVAASLLRLFTPAAGQARSLQDKARDLIDIRDWSGIGTGHDDTTAMRQAIAQAVNTRIQIPGGMILHTGRLDLNSGTSTTQVYTGFRGLGMCQIKLIDHTNDHHVVVGQWDRIILENVYLDGDKANQTGTIHGLYFPAGDSGTTFKELPAFMSNVIVRSYLSDNINVEQYRSHGFMRGVTSELAGRDAYGNAAVDWQHSDLSCGLCGRDAISIGNEWSGQGIKAYGAGLTDSTGAGLHILATAVNVRILGLQCDSNYRHGVKVENTSYSPYEPRAFVIKGALFSWNGRNTAGSYSDVYVDGAGLNMPNPSFVSAFSGPGGASAITQKYNVEFGPNFPSGQVLNVGKIENYLGAVSAPGTFLGLTSDFKKLSYSTGTTVNEAVTTSGRVMRHTSATQTVESAFVGSESFSRFQRAMNGNWAWGPGSADLDCFVGRQGANLVGAYFGTSWQAGQEGTYSGGHLTIGGNHVWAEANGKLRVKSGAPSTATDGAALALGDLTNLSAAGLTNAADDTAAATASVPVGAAYRTGSTLKVRVS